MGQIGKIGKIGRIGNLRNLGNLGKSITNLLKFTKFTKLLNLPPKSAHYFSLEVPRFGTKSKLHWKGGVLSVHLLSGQ